MTRDLDITIRTAVLRLLPLVLWMGWGADLGPSAPADGPATGARIPAAAPLADVALPNAASLRIATPDAGDRLVPGIPGGAAGANGEPLALGAAGATSDSHRQGPSHSFRSLLEQDSNRVRGPPSPVG